MRAIVVSAAGAVVTTVTKPAVLSVPAYTVSPGRLSTGRDSPVMGDSSNADTPSSTTPSSGTRSPGRTTIVLPTGTSAGLTSTSAPPCRRRARSGVSVNRSPIERLVRSTDRDSSIPPSANRTITVAPSLHSPNAAAPLTASVMSTFMSRVRAVSEATARRHTSDPPTMIASANAAIDGTSDGSCARSQPSTSKIAATPTRISVRFLTHHDTVGSRGPPSESTASIAVPRAHHHRHGGSTWIRVAVVLNEQESAREVDLSEQDAGDLPYGHSHGPRAVGSIQPPKTVDGVPHRTRLVQRKTTHRLLRRA